MNTELQPPPASGSKPPSLNLPYLPPEMISSIFSQLESTPGQKDGLLSCSLASFAFSELTRRYRFCDVDVPMQWEPEPEDNDESDTIAEADPVPTVQDSTSSAEQDSRSVEHIPRAPESDTSASGISTDEDKTWRTLHDFLHTSPFVCNYIQELRLDMSSHLEDGSGGEDARLLLKMLHHLPQLHTLTLADIDFYNLPLDVFDGTPGRLKLSQLIIDCKRVVPEYVVFRGILQILSLFSYIGCLRVRNVDFNMDDALSDWIVRGAEFELPHLQIDDVEVNNVYPLGPLLSALTFRLHTHTPRTLSLGDFRRQDLQSLGQYLGLAWSGLQSLACDFDMVFKDLLNGSSDASGDIELLNYLDLSACRALEHLDLRFTMQQPVTAEAVDGQTNTDVTSRAMHEHNERIWSYITQILSFLSKAPSSLTAITFSIVVPSADVLQALQLELSLVESLLVNTIANGGLKTVFFALRKHDGRPPQKVVCEMFPRLQEHGALQIRYE
ncbi:hypothetical protein PHLCEN_2v13115 [Hermanssonia centrifuga]|uniref:Uncharacterized protein n=1 Tax=Hermanssonia centrifuga TaxID=98765 RepID=A0A2R6NFB7_9APHY|nr:hypothetical protein PHLCEN_2v13115 [Hermanssonia centrifuga]